jgi:hypothetical protein
MTTAQSTRLIWISLVFADVRAEGNEGKSRTYMMEGVLLATTEEGASL